MGNSCCYRENPAEIVDLPKNDAVSDRKSPAKEKKLRFIRLPDDENAPERLSAQDAFPHQAENKEGLTSFRAPTKRLTKPFLSKFRIISKLGNTAIGDFVLAEELSSDQLRIIRKVTRDTELSSQKTQEAMLRTELSVLAGLSHPNILVYEKVLFDERFIYAISEAGLSRKFLNHTTIMHSNSDILIAEVTRQILSTLTYCHSVSVCHGSLCLANLFFFEGVTEQICVKITGFGSVPAAGFSKSEENGTVYSAPEALSGRPCAKSDVWSCAVVLFLLAAKGLPFQAENISEFIVNIGRYPPKFPQSWGPKKNTVKSLLQAMLKVDVSLRISAAEAIQHRWLQENISEVGRDLDLIGPVLANMKAFVKTSRLKMMLLSFVLSRTTPPKARQSLMYVFNSIDFDRDGVLNLSDLVRAYSLIIPRDHAELLANHVLEMVDIDGNSQIDFSEFLIAAVNYKSLNSEKKLREAFDILDEDRSMEVSLEELKKVLRGSVSEKLWREFVQEADEDRNGRISFKEFLRIVKVAGNATQEIS